MRNYFKKIVNCSVWALLLVLWFVPGVQADAQVVQSASEYSYPPFALVSETGEADGFAVELLRATMAAVGREVDFYVGPWAELREDLQSGEVEVLPLVGRTPERESIYDFTVPYLSIYGNIFVRTDNTDIKSLADLEDKSLIVMKGDNAEEYARRNNVSNDIVQTADFGEAFQLLAAGQHDAIIIQEVVGLQIINEFGIQNVRPVFRINDFKQDFTFAVQEGNAALLAQLNEGLSIIIANGTYDKLWSKWLADISTTGTSNQVEQNEVVLMSPEISTRQKALEIADQIGAYLRANPDLSLTDLQADEFFQKIAVQRYGDTGYSVLMDAQSGYFYFHPQDKLQNVDPRLQSATLSEWWDIIARAIGPECQESEGEYSWIEEDGQVTKKYMNLVCLPVATADGKNFLVAVTNYLNEAEGEKYVREYRIDSGFSFAQNSINQRAVDIAKQIELYIKANPQKTLADLQQDKDFQFLAVQQVGATGYTYLVTHETGILNFHPDPKIRDTSYETFKDKFPAIWQIINQSVRAEPCQDSNGFYEWADIEGVHRHKYTYHHCIGAETADGFSFFVGASTYLDEYNNLDLSGMTGASSREQIFPQYVIMIFGVLVLVIMILVVLQFMGVITIRGAAMYAVLAGFFIVIGGMYIISSYITVKNLREVFLASYVEQHYQQMYLQADKVIEQVKGMRSELKFLAEAESSIGAENQDLRELLSSAYARSEKYVYASYRIDESGFIRDMYPPDIDIIGADISTQDHIIKIAETKQPVLSNIFDAVEGFQGLVLQYPVMKNGVYDGSVAFLVNIDDLLAGLNIFANHTTPHDSFLLDKNQFIILSNNPEYLGTQISANEKFSQASEEFEQITAVSKEGYFEYSIKDDEQIAVYLPLVIEDNKWFLVESSRLDNIYHGADGALNSIWFFTLMTLISLAVLGFSSSYFLTGSLRKEVNRQTRKVSQKAQQIETQLRKEAEINQEKERLLVEQARAKLELEEKLEELEKFQKLTVDREMKMIELKKEIAALKNKL